MDRRRCRTGLVASCVGLAVVAAAGVAALADPAVRNDWSYHGEGTSPEFWASMNPAWAIAATGHRQSPVNIVTSKVRTNTRLWSMIWGDVDEQNQGATIVNNGHTIQVNVPAGPVVRFESKDYTLKQFHFHSPAEHYIDGKTVPLCVHLVHQSTDGKLLVVEVRYKNGKANPLIDQIFAAITAAPEEQPEAHAAPHEDGAHEAHHDVATVKATFPIYEVDLLPLPFDYYTLPGSLTTPACDEIVTWVIMKTEVESAGYIPATMHELFGGDNNRPPQPLHDRVVERYVDDGK